MTRGKKPAATIAEAKTFAERLMSQKGVESVKLTTISVEE